MGKKFFRSIPLLVVFYMSGIQHGDFMSLSNVKGSATEKLNCIIFVTGDLWNLRIHLETLADENLEAIGYHRGCYQKFT